MCWVHPPKYKASSGNSTSLFAGKVMEKALAEIKLTGRRNIFHQPNQQSQKKEKTFQVDKSFYGSEIEITNSQIKLVTFALKKKHQPNKKQKTQTNQKTPLPRASWWLHGAPRGLYHMAPLGLALHGGNDFSGVDANLCRWVLACHRDRPCRDLLSSQATLRVSERPLLCGNHCLRLQGQRESRSRLPSCSGWESSYGRSHGRMRAAQGRN